MKKIKQNLEIVSKLDKRGLVEEVYRVSGLSRHDSENAINAVSMALGIWATGMIRDLPADTQATCKIEGFGYWVVKYAKPDRWSFWRARDGLPQKSARITMEFCPGQTLTKELKQANKPVREAYLKEYRAAYAALRARKQAAREQSLKERDEALAQDPSPIRQSIMDEIAELEGKSPYWHGQFPFAVLPPANPAPWDTDSGKEASSETQEIIPEIMPAEDNRQNYPALSSMDKTQLKYFSEHPDEEKRDSADNPIDPAAQEEIIKAQYKAGKLEGDPGAYLLKGTQDRPAQDKELITTLREIRDTQDPEIYDDAIAAITPYIRQPAIPLADQGIESYDTLSAVEQQIKRLKAQKAANPIKSRYEPEFP